MHVLRRKIHMPQHVFRFSEDEGIGPVPDDQGPDDLLAKHHTVIAKQDVTWRLRSKTPRAYYETASMTSVDIPIGCTQNLSSALPIWGAHCLHPEEVAKFFDHPQLELREVCW